MSWKNILKIIAALVLFALLQNIFLVAFAIASGYQSDLVTFIHLFPEKMAIALILSGLSTSFAIYKMRMTRWPQSFFWNKLHWKYAIIGIIASLSAILASNMLCEIVALPDLMQMQFEGMAENLWGILAIAIIGPVVEELIFREGIQGFMVRHNTSPWTAILTSAILFGVIHMNPAQVPFAFIIGLCLSIIYHKTDSIALTSLIHILNNASAVIQMNVLDEKMKHARISEFLGFSPFEMYVSIFFLSIFSICLFRFFWKKVKCLTP